MKEATAGCLLKRSGMREQGSLRGGAFEPEVCGQKSGSPDKIMESHLFPLYSRYSMMPLNMHLNMPLNFEHVCRQYRANKNVDRTFCEIYGIRHVYNVSVAE